MPSLTFSGQKACCLGANKNLTGLPDFNSSAHACGRLRGKAAGSLQMPRWLQACWHLVVPGA